MNARTLRILIVDDEPTILNGIRDSIPWQQLGFEEPAVATNGSEALELMKYTVPDLLLTDIKMPTLTGLDLIRLATGLYPGLKVVILSGYDEFAYAQQAIELGVSAYLLKPIYKDDLSAVLRRLRDEIGREERSGGISSKNFDESENDILKNYGLNELLTQNGTDAGVLLDKLYPGRSAALLHHPAIALINGGRDSRLKNVVEGQISLQDEQDFFTFCDRQGFIGIIFPWERLERIRLLLSQIQPCFRSSLTMGVGNPCENLSELAASYGQADLAVKSAFYRGKGQMLFFSEIPPFQKTLRYPLQTELDLAEAVKKGDREMAGRCVETFFNAVLHEGFLPVGSLMNTVSILLGSIAKTFARPGAYSPSTAHYLFVEELIHIDTLEGMKRYVQEYVDNAVEYLHQSNDVYQRKIIRDAMQYLNRAYRTASLTAMASRLFINPTYLSFLLKVETGKTFTELVTEVRIEKAKKMLGGTHLKNYEVAEAVGYKDARYFGQLFKRKVGVLPGEYKNNLA